MRFTKSSRRLLFGIVLLTVVLAQPTTAKAQNGNILFACVHRTTSDVRIVPLAEPCRPAETRISWNIVGAVGPAGPPGFTNKAQHSWVGGTTGTNVWTTIPGSSFTATTYGGSLMINLNLYIIGAGGSHSTCQPTIDGNWAGAYGGLPNPGDPFWKEGLVFSGAGGWVAWTTNRLYPGVPAGTHTFAVQCATNSGSAGYCNASSIGCSMNFLEIP